LRFRRPDQHGAFAVTAAQVGRVLGAVRRGFSGTLVLRGGHGTGKYAIPPKTIATIGDMRERRADVRLRR